MIEEDILITKEDAKKEIGTLVKKYNEVIEVKKYNEEMTKGEFIEPLFEALGWDVRNKTHSDEVTREEKISKKKVDYGFRINGIPRFYLEAKALKTDLHDRKFIEQAIDYAWMKGCTWAVLSNFENVMIFNAELKNKDLLQNLVKSISCLDFDNKFNELWLLSKESFSARARTLLLCKPRVSLPEVRPQAQGLLPKLPQS
jgi:hypothetical protein